MPAKPKRIRLNSRVAVAYFWGAILTAFFFIHLYDLNTAEPYFL